MVTLSVSNEVQSEDRPKNPSATHEGMAQALSEAEVPLRIISWNVASWKSLIPYVESKFGSVPSFLDHLSVDIFCIQEAKIARDKLRRGMAVWDGWDSFWSFSCTKKGYSGVATFVRAGSGYMPLSADDRPFKDDELDDEGRCVRTDHGAFVLYNVYVPNAGDRATGRPRLDYKMRFLERLRQLRA